jgi:uncharacterized repeat protein (TIGR03803 family)
MEIPVILNVLFLTLSIVAFQSTQAQMLVPLHYFTNGDDGAYPVAGLTWDSAGNLYGTASQGGAKGYGTVFKMTHKSGGWLFTTLYTFTGGTDGAYPWARVIRGPDGTLYGTTSSGGEGCGSSGCGTVFSLRPPATACRTAQCPWKETVLYRFAGGDDGERPGTGDLLFDAGGNLYGTTIEGGSSGCGGQGCGMVFELTPASGGQWTESVLYRFAGGDDGGFPYGGVTFDQVGNLYGTTAQAGLYNCGTVFELIPAGASWTEDTLHAFNQNLGDGCTPEAGLTFDQAGNLVGTTALGSYQGGGSVFELMPSGGGWTESLLYAFTSFNSGPAASLTLDATGNLYGTTLGSGAYGLGNVFKLTPSDGGWLYTSLHDFIDYDGEYPNGNVILDATGNIYGTTELGTEVGFGSVFEITP